MKNLLQIFLSCTVASIALASSDQILVRVLDEESTPVAGATVQVTYIADRTDGTLGGDPKIVSGTTGETGQSVVRLPGKAAFAVVVDKPGYYRSRLQTQLGTERADITLRPIKNPIAMLVKEVRYRSVREGKDLAYDFEIGDWLPPFGQGKRADILFSQETSITPDRFERRVRIHFSNEGDGIQPLDYGRFGQSLFKSPRSAPIEGYAPELKKSSRDGKFDSRQPNVEPAYFLRVRTIKDSEGRILSAHYVKMLRDFPDFVYYMNPKPLDRNMEFDVRINLLKSGETSALP